MVSNADVRCAGANQLPNRQMQIERALVRSESTAMPPTEGSIPVSRATLTDPTSQQLSLFSYKAIGVAGGYGRLRAAQTQSYHHRMVAYVARHLDEGTFQAARAYLLLVDPSDQTLLFLEGSDNTGRHSHKRAPLPPPLLWRGRPACSPGSKSPRCMLQCLKAGSQWRFVFIDASQVKY
jgi:hypothetical protein